MAHRLPVSFFRASLSMWVNLMCIQRRAQAEHKHNILFHVSSPRLPHVPSFQKKVDKNKDCASQIIERDLFLKLYE